jgi:ferredoxin-type protein NapH
MGAFLSMVARFSRLKLKFKSSCKNCAACAKAYCSYQAMETGETLPVVNEGDCTRCGECVNRCPKQSLELGRNSGGKEAGLSVPVPGKPELEPTT